MNQSRYPRLSKSPLNKVDDFWTKLPDHVKRGIEKSLEQIKNGQTKTYTEVKTILANR